MRLRGFVFPALLGLAVAAAFPSPAAAKDGHGKGKAKGHYKHDKHGGKHQGRYEYHGYQPRYSGYRRYRTGYAGGYRCGCGRRFSSRHWLTYHRRHSSC